MFDVKTIAFASLYDLVIQRKITVTYDRYSSCDTCHGLKTIDSWRRPRPCPSCAGEGGAMKETTVDISLSPGNIDVSGGTYRIAKKGHVMSNYMTGDLIVEVEVIDHGHFMPHGKDLICQVPLSPLQRKFGGTVTVPTLEGYHPRLFDPSTDQDWKLEGAGGYQRGDTQRGDIIYQWCVAHNELEDKALDHIQAMEAALEKCKNRAVRQRAQHNHEKKQIENAFKQEKEQLNHWFYQEKERLSDENGRAQAKEEKAAEQDKLAAVSSLIEDMLPSIDSLEKALDTMTSPADKAHRQGIEMILEMQRKTLTKQGVNVIPALGEAFNPHVHEAVAVDRESDLKKNTITDVLQTGYLHHGKLLRPAMVRVSG